MENKTVKELKSLAKDRGIPRYYRMRKAELIEALGNTPQSPISVSNTSSNILDEPIPEINVPILDKTTTNKCLHGKVKYYCKDCEGSQICSHNRRKTRCRECNGGSICEHKRVRYLCKDCVGKGICSHGRQKFFCKDCGGSQICKHNRQKSHCRACHATQQARECL